MQAIESLRQAGFNIWLEGEKIHYKQQVDNVDQDNVSLLLAEIKNHKDEVIKYLQSQERGVTLKTTSQADNSLDPDFTKANLIIKFHSDLLNEDFYLVSNQKLKAKIEAKNPGIVVYLPQEIEYLTGLEPEAIKKLHCLRNAFGGAFIARNKAEDSIFNQPKETLSHYRYPSFIGADQQVIDNQKPWSVADCPLCKCYVHWPNYPPGGGTKDFCGYWIHFTGKSKKIEISKIKQCPKL